MVNKVTKVQSSSQPNRKDAKNTKNTQDFIALALNPKYVGTKQTIAQIKNHVLENQSILLLDGLENYEQIRKFCSQLSFMEKRDPIHYCFSIFEFSITEQLKQNLKNLLALVPLPNPRIISVTAFKLTHKNYSMLTDEDEEESRAYDIIIDLSRNSSSICYVDSDQEPLEIESNENAITIIRASPYFYRYVNHRHSQKMFIRITVDEA
jgi:ketopantoate reductase